MPSAHRVLRSSAALCVTAVALALLPSVATAAREGPKLSVPAAQLASSLTCSPGLGRARSAPVLLTPAFSDAETSYGWNYIRQLRADGIAFCSISVPDEGYGDLQRTAEHVVYAVRRMAAESGRKVVLVGHQHGALDELWALTYWPDVARSVSDLVSLATPFQGTTSSTGLCGPGGRCTAALRQITRGSRFLAALRDAPLPRGVAITSIASANDALITPQPLASRLPGARNVQLQDLCPARVVDHFATLADSVAYGLFRDARSRPGPADPRRLRAGACSTRFMRAADPAVLGLTGIFLGSFAARNAASDDREPATRPYARRRAPVVTVLSRRALISPAAVALRLRCRSVGQTDCQVTVTATDGAGGRAGTTQLTIAPGQPRTATVELSGSRAGDRYRLRVRAVDALGNVGTVRSSITAAVSPPQ